MLNIKNNSHKQQYSNSCDKRVDNIRQAIREQLKVRNRSVNFKIQTQNYGASPLKLKSNTFKARQITDYENFNALAYYQNYQKTQILKTSTPFVEYQQKKQIYRNQPIENVINQQIIRKTTPWSLYHRIIKLKDSPQKSYLLFGDGDFIQQ